MQSSLWRHLLPFTAPPPCPRAQRFVARSWSADRSDRNTTFGLAFRFVDRFCANKGYEQRCLALYLHVLRLLNANTFKTCLGS